MKKNRKRLAFFLALTMVLIFMPTAVSAVDTTLTDELAKYETEVTLEFDFERGDNADVTDLVLVLKKYQTANPAVDVTAAAILGDVPQNSADMGGAIS